VNANIVSQGIHQRAEYFVNIVGPIEGFNTDNINRVKSRPLLEKLPGIVGYITHHKKWCVIQGICTKELEDVWVAEPQPELLDHWVTLALGQNGHKH
jgi:hypothetical protein